LENAALFSSNAAWQIGTPGGRLAAPASRAKPLAKQAIRALWLKTAAKMLQSNTWTNSQPNRAPRPLRHRAHRAKKRAVLCRS
jgi:hypothetical protein